MPTGRVPGSRVSRSRGGGESARRRGTRAVRYTFLKRTPYPIPACLGALLERPLLRVHLYAAAERDGQDLPEDGPRRRHKGRRVDNARPLQVCVGVQAASAGGGPGGRVGAGLGVCGGGGGGAQSG